MEKSDLDEVAYVMCQVGEWPIKFIICRQDVLRCDFGDVDEAMFHDDERPFERIFYILGTQKSDLDVVAEVMF
jgi:hypothetical protein